MAEPELVYLPLGGSGEIGMNLNLYGLGPADDRAWLMVDMGITFGDDTTPGIDVLMPDPAFIEERRERLQGILLTHGHEDHLGAVPYLWERFRCPVYATPFTAALLRRKLEMDGLKGVVDLREIPLSSRFDIGPFSLELIKLTHSMPEPNAVVLRTPLGNVLHSGDWKLDPDPVIEKTADEAALEALGREGILAAIVDSTNVFEPGHSGSEAELLASLTELIGTCKARVAVTCFASNVARLQTLFHAASANGRAVALVGRSLWRINAAARETGYLADLPPFLEAEEGEALPREAVLYICTGSQGEPRAALSRIATDSFRELALEAGDTVIFSSRVIPGNELAIGRVQNRLVGKGVHVIGWKDHFVHVSGHPAQEEIRRMYELVRPPLVIPMHGETRHLVRHGELAREWGVPEVKVIANGDMLRLAPGAARIVGEVPTGRLVVDGNRLVPLDGSVLRQRGKALFNGSAVLTLVVDGDGALAAEPQIATQGLLDPDEESCVVAEMEEVIREALDDLSDKKRRDDAALGEAVRRAVRRSFRDSHGKRPLTTVHLVRV